MPYYAQVYPAQQSSSQVYQVYVNDKGQVIPGQVPGQAHGQVVYVQPQTQYAKEESAVRSVCDCLICSATWTICCNLIFGCFWFMYPMNTFLQVCV